MLAYQAASLDLLGWVLRAHADGLQVLGTIGALDPHTYKTRHATHQGEGLLEQEGVRPHRPHPPAIPTSSVTGESSCRRTWE